LAEVSAALAGDLDPTYGPGGYNVTSAEVSAAATGWAIARQNDGKLVVAGEAWNGSRYVGVVGRLNADGSADPSFWTGFAAVDQGDGLETTFQAVAVQPDGKILAAGRRTQLATGASTALFARFNADGSADAGFGQNGVASIGPTGSSDSFSIAAIALLADGKILAAGTRWPGSAGNDGLVLRLTSAGALDTSFYLGGYKYVNSGWSEELQAITLQPDGKILVAGTRSSGFTSEMFAARLFDTGAVQASFGQNGNGFATVSLNGKEAGQGLALASDGKIVVAGHTDTGSATSRDVALARFTANGRLDTSFSGDGKHSFSVGAGWDSAAAVAITSGAQIVVGGYGAHSSGRTDILFARLTWAGALDTSFDGDGVRLVQFGSAAAGEGLLLQPDGRAVVVGNRSDGVDTRIALVRANTSGALDAGFDGDGRATLALHDGNDEVRASAMQSDGKIVVAGVTWDGFRDLCFVARFTAAGALDTSFSGDGKLTFLFAGTTSCTIGAVAVHANQRIVVAGGDRIGRLTAAGAWDPAFDGDGQRSLALAEGTALHDLIVGADNKIWAAGGIVQGGVSRLAVIRLSEGGGLDTGFSADGWATAAIGGGNQWVERLALHPDGRYILLAAHENADPRVVALLATGAVHGNFGVGGSVVLDGNPAKTDTGGGLLVQPDGTIVATTATRLGGSGTITLPTIVAWRLHSGGAFDATFGAAGKRELTEIVNGSAPTILRQSDGKLVLVGAGVTSTSEGGCLFVRLTSAGAYDPSYGGGDGRRAYQPGYSCRVRSAHFAPGTNNVVAAGVETFTPPPGGLSRKSLPYDFIVLRVLGQ
jgi:uncharacterized delta-60 repeat protein